MKKFFFFVFIFISFFIFPSLVRADSYGYNVVNNFYNTDGSFNDKVFELLAGGTATVRLISGEINAHPGLIADIEAAAREYSINLIWQPEDWHATTSAEFNSFWVEQLSHITMGTISLFTEYNYFDGSPSEYAAILQSALSAGFQVPVGTTNFNITNPTGSGMTQYVEFLQEVDNNCHCLSQIPVWSVSIYGRYDGTNVNQAVDDFINQLQGFKDALASLGIDLAGKTIIIPEAGLDPGKPIGERLNLAVQFAQELENRGVPGVEGITFLLMDDKTGKQYLVVKVCDPSGNCQWVVMDYSDFGIIGLSGPGGSGQLKRAGTAQGESFIVEVSAGLFWDSAESARSAALKKAAKVTVKGGASNIDVSDNEALSMSLKEVNQKIIPPGVTNQNEERVSAGKILFEVCEEDTYNWFVAEGDIDLFDIPNSYQRASTNGQQIAGFMMPPGDSIASLLTQDFQAVSFQQTAFSFQEGNELLEENKVLGNQALAADNPCPNISFSAWGDTAGGDYGLLCWEIKGQPGDLSYCDWGYNITVNGQVVGGLTMLGGANNCLVNPSGGATITCHDGGASPAIFSGSGQVGLTITTVRGPESYDCRPDLARQINCIVEGDKIICTDVGGNPIVPPPPPLCKIRHNSGDNIGKKDVGSQGDVVLEAEASWSPQDLLDAIENFFQGLAESIGLKKTFNFVFTPYATVSFTNPDERIQREGIYYRLALPGHGLGFGHGETEGDKFALEMEDKSSEKAVTNLDFYGQEGPKDAYDYTEEYLTPPRGWGW